MGPRSPRHVSLLLHTRHLLSKLIIASFALCLSLLPSPPPISFCSFSPSFSLLDPRLPPHLFQAPTLHLLCFLSLWLQPLNLSLYCSPGRHGNGSHVSKESRLLVPTLVQALGAGEPARQKLPSTVHIPEQACSAGHPPPSSRPRPMLAPL